MKKGGVLNQKLSSLIASMGHMDMVTICDSGLPIPTNVERIDLAVSPGIPAFLDILRAIAAELEVQEMIFAEELEQRSPSLLKSVQDLFPNSSVKTISHENFKKLSKESKAIVRSGETTPYANVILVSGVIF